MGKKSLILVIILLLTIIGGGVFYWWWNGGEEVDGPVELYENEKPPRLFAKEDYKIEEREDGVYIVVEKVGITAKVPDGWTIKLEGDDWPESEYWVNLLSTDVEKEQGLLKKGCLISITAGQEQANNQELKEQIKLVKETEAGNDVETGHKSATIQKIDDHEVLAWLSSEIASLGQVAGIDIPLANNNVTSLYAVFQPEYQEQCEPIWQEFVENLKIK